MEPESATRLIVRFAALKAIHIRGAGAPPSRHGAQCVNSPVTALLLALPGRTQNGSERPQSIIAALRMQTIVACAGFPLRLRMR